MTCEDVSQIRPHKHFPLLSTRLLWEFISISDRSTLYKLNHLRIMILLILFTINNFFSVFIYLIHPIYVIYYGIFLLIFQIHHQIMYFVPNLILMIISRFLWRMAFFIIIFYYYEYANKIYTKF